MFGPEVQLKVDLNMECRLPQPGWEQVSSFREGLKHHCMGKGCSGFVRQNNIVKWNTAQ